MSSRWVNAVSERHRGRIDPGSFSQDLASLLAAGVTASDALSALARRESSAGRLVTIERMVRDLREGRPLSEAFRASQNFPDLLVATVAASEQTGDVATGLLRYARHQQSLQAVRDRVVSACVYPFLLLAVSTVVIALLLGIVVPRFATLIDLEGRNLPFFSRVLMDWGRFVTAHPKVAIAIFALLLTVAVFCALQLRNPAVRRRLLAAIPGVNRMAREFQHLQMYRTTAILTSRGIPIHKALLHGVGFLSPDDQARLASAVTAMREGTGVSAALSASGFAEPIAASMLAVADKSGAMSEMLDRTADFFERDLQRNIEIVSRLIEPALMIIFGVIIGTLVILMYIPIFDFATSVS